MSRNDQIILAIHKISLCMLHRSVASEGPSRNRRLSCFQAGHFPHFSARRYFAYAREALALLRETEKCQQKSCRGRQMCWSHQQVQGPVWWTEWKSFPWTWEKQEAGCWPFPWLPTEGPTWNASYPLVSCHTLGLQVIVKSQDRLKEVLREQTSFLPPF